MRFNRDVEECAPAPIAEAWSWVKNPESDTLLNLCQAMPAHLPPQSLLDDIGAAIIAGRGASYTPVHGITPLRQALAENINQLYGGDVGADDTTITSGCNQAFCAVIDSLCMPGDKVIMPLPHYFNHAMWLSIRGIGVQSLPFNAQTTDPDSELAETLIDARTRAIVLVTPNNPTGAIYSEQCLESFYRLAERHNIALIVDETYRDFIAGDVPPHNLFKQTAWRENFVHLYSFSKVYSLTGYRVGAIVAGGNLHKQLEKIQDCVAINAPHIGQLAALYGLQHLDSWKRQKTHELIQKGKAIQAAFSDPELHYQLLSTGAYFAYIKHPFDQDARTVARYLAEEHELISLPGSYFGGGQEHYLRFAFANLESDQFPEIVRRLIASQTQ